MFALQGLRVLDITQVMAGSYCSMLLADMGADVIKLERPGRGDDTRWMGAVETHHGDSPAFQAVNRNKRGLAVDLRDPRGAAVVHELVASVDVLVENFRPGTLARLGLGYEELHALHPALIYCSISGFGGTGPYAGRGGFDLVAQGMSGLMSLTGEKDGPPVKVGVPLTDLNAGMLGAYGVLAAYVHRLRTGQGQLVDTSLFEAGIASTAWETALYTSEGVVSERNGSAHRLIAPYEAFPTADGWINVGAANQVLWERLCRVTELPGLITDPRFASARSRVVHRADLAATLSTALVGQTTDTWVVTLTAAGIPCGPIYDIAQVHADPQAHSRRMLVEVDHPRLGATQHIGVPVKLSVTPGDVRLPAPMLGQHTREVLAEAGIDMERVADLFDDGVLYDVTDEEIRA